MHLFTILSSIIVLAGARPVPQSSLPTDSASLNSTTTISVQDALSLLSSATPASATSVSASSVAVVGSASASITSGASVASASALASSSISLASANASSTNAATGVFSGDLSAPTPLTDGSGSDSTDSTPADLPSDSAPPTGNSTDTTSAPFATATSGGISYIMPTDIPQACIARGAAQNASASSVVTASIPDSTGVLANSSSSVLSSVDTSTLSATASPSAFNTSATDALLSGSSVADTSATASASAASGSAAASSDLASAFASVGGSASLSASAASVTASATGSVVPPLTLVKRTAQADLPDVAQSWQDLCLVSGGDIFTNEPCVQLAGVKGINALLADADPCDQQDNADAMIDFAKSAGVTNADVLIANAVAYRQHPRNAFSINGVIPSTPYCQRAPRNVELQGLANAQLPDVNPGVFGGPSFGLVAFGDSSSCPFGTSPDVNTCGCS